MPPAQKINVSAIVFDLLMDRKKSLQILKEITVHMNLVHKKDRTNLILLHSKVTSDPKYTNISLVSSDSHYGPNLFSKVEEAESGPEADWMEALAMAADILSGYTEIKGVHTLQLIFITDMQRELKGDKDINDLIDFMREKFIYLYVIGPKVEIPICVTDRSDIARCMAAMEVDKSKNWHALKELLVETEGIMCGADFGLDFLQYYVEMAEKQPWQVPLTFKGFEFPTRTSRVMDKEVLPKLNVLNKTQSKFFLVEDDDMEIAPEDVIRVYCFLDKVISIPKIVSEEFEYRGPRQFKLIGFISRDDLDEVFMEGGEIHCVQVEKENPKYEAFVALVQATKRANKLGLALRSYNANNAPRLYVLIPMADKFHMVPHAELINDDAFIVEPADKHFVKSSLVEKFGAYLGDLAMTTRALHPTLEAGPFHKMYVKNAVRILLDGAKPQPQVPHEELKTDGNLYQLEAALKKSDVKLEAAAIQKIDEDVQDEW